MTAVAVSGFAFVT